MDLLKSYYDKKVEDYELIIQRNKESGNVVLSFCSKSTGKKILLKFFKTENDYRRYLFEAVALRCLTDDKTRKKARDIYRKMIDFLEDDTGKL